MTMKSTTVRSIATLFLTLIAVETLTERISNENYSSLISDVREYYHTSCVIFVHRGNYQDLNRTAQLHKWSLEFSRQRVMTMTVTFEELVSKYNEYRKFVRPLFVVLLDTEESVNAFANTTRRVRPISFPAWFVMFLPQRPGCSLEEYCRHPTENTFNVNFNTIMLVLCCEHPVLTEWYATHNKRIRTFELVTWKPDEGLILMTQKSLYARRSDLFGDTMRVASVDKSPFILLANGTIDGFLGALLMELSRVMNFTMQILDQVEGYGSWNQEKKVWTGVIGQLVTDKADLGIGEFSVTPHRLDVVDFTLPLIYTPNRLYIKQPDNSDVQWLGYFKAFSLEIWAGLITIILCVPVLLTIMKTKGRISWSLILENYLHVWGIYCQQGLSEFPNESSMRLAFLSIFVSSLIILAAYSASLISFLTLPTASLPFSTLEGFIADGTYKLSVLQNTSDYDMFHHAKDSMMIRINSLMNEKERLPLQHEDGFKQVCEEKNVAFYTTEVMRNTVEMQCKIAFVESGKFDIMAMSLQKESPYTGIMNYHIWRFMNNGVMSRLREKYLSSIDSKETKHDMVGLWGIAPILALVAGGTVLSVFILILEKMYHAFKTQRRSKKSFVRKLSDKPEAELHVKLQGRRKKPPKLKRFCNAVYARPTDYWS